MKASLDDTFRPIKMTCAGCSGEMTVYPNESNGTGVCPECSPVWLDSFAKFQMNQMREKHGLLTL